MSDVAPDWIVEIDIAGAKHEFPARVLPISLGDESAADVSLPGAAGTIQIGLLDDVFFVQPGRNARNLRLDGELVAGSRKLRDGATIAFDRARLACSLGSKRLRLAATAVETAGDTAPPDL